MAEAAAANRPGKGDSVERAGGAGASTSAVFTFGRFQPPTKGHQVLVDQVITTAATKGADAYVFVSAKQNDKAKYLRSAKHAEMKASGSFVSFEGNENPLSVYTKVALLQKQHAGKPVKFINTEVCSCRDVFKVVDRLRSAGYTDITMLVGSDRVPQFQKMFTPKASASGAEGAAAPKPVEVLAAGEERNINANKAAAPASAAGGAGGNANIALKAMSGTKMRKAAIAGDLKTLASGVKFGGVSDANIKALANEIRTELGYEALAGGGATRRRRRRSRTRRRGSK